jgi:hypothetical protein
MAVDWAELALVSRQEQWVAAHPVFFVVSTAKLVRPQRAGATVTVPAVRVRETLLGITASGAGSGGGSGGGAEGGPSREPTGSFRLVDGSRAPARERATRPLVLPLRKVQVTFPSMITVGRTENNDLVVPDEQVSKFHAFFRLVGDKVELSDAGSRNGTFVSGQRLEARGAAVAMKPRDLCAFGALEFQLFDSRGCWEFLRKLERF